MEAPSPAKLMDFAVHPLEFEPEHCKAKSDELLQHAKALLQDPRWETFSSSNGIEAKILDAKDGRIPVKYCRSIIKCPPAELFKYLVTDITETHKEFNDVMYHAATLKQLTKTEKILTIISHGFPVRDREDVCFVSEVDKNGVLYELSVGISEDLVPMNPNGAALRSVGGKPWAVRSHMHFAMKVIRPVEGGCEYTTMWQYDPQGWTCSLLGKRKFGEICLKNLVHEHEKLRELWDPKGVVHVDKTIVLAVQGLASVLSAVGATGGVLFYVSRYAAAIA